MDRNLYYNRKFCDSCGMDEGNLYSFEAPYKLNFSGKGTITRRFCLCEKCLMYYNNKLIEDISSREENVKKIVSERCNDLNSKFKQENNQLEINKFKNI